MTINDVDRELQFKKGNYVMKEGDKRIYYINNISDSAEYDDEFECYLGLYEELQSLGRL